MKRDPISELRALMFGEESHEDYFTPDLAILVDLAPSMEDEMLLQVVEQLSYMGAFPQERYRTLTALLAYFPESGRERALGSLVLRDLQFIQFLPEALILRTVEGLRAVETHIGYRSEAILALASRLPREQRATLLLEEALSAAREPSWAYTQHRAIIKLVGIMEDPLPPEAADELLGVVQGLEGLEYQLRGSAALAPLLPQPLGDQITQQVLTEVRNLDNPTLQAEILLILGSRTSGTQKEDILAEATRAARAIDLQKSERVDLLIKLSLYIPEPTRHQILDEAVRPYEEGIFLWPSAAEALVEAFGGLVPILPPHLEGAFRSQVQTLTLSPEFQKLQPLIPYLSEEHLEVALESIFTLGWDEAMADALITLTPHLTAGLMPKALEMISGWGSEKPKSEALLALIPHLPEDMIGVALEIAEGIQSDLRRWRIANAFQELPGLSEDTHPVLSSPSVEQRLRQLWSPLPRNLQQDLIDELIDRIWDFYGGAEAAMVEDVGDLAPTGEEVAWAGETGDDDTGAWIVEGDGYAFYEPEASESEPAPEPAEDWLDEANYHDLGDVEEAMADEWDGVEAEIAPEEIEVEELLARAEIPDWIRRPVVNTGFAPQETPDVEIPRIRSLVKDQAYYFWLNIGAQKDTAIAIESPALDLSKLPPEVVLKVVLFGFPSEIEILPGADMGEVKILPNRRAIVTQQVIEPDNLIDRDRLADHLYFPVKTPTRTGDCRLRCNLYYQGVLVQSHLITARVVAEADLPSQGEIDLSEGLPLRHILDYKLTHTLRGEVITDLSAHSLSILLNDDGDGTHGFRFFGGDDATLVKEQASFTGLELQDMIEQARGALRAASWGSKDEWQESAPYRYEAKPPDSYIDRLLGDLVRFAKWGTRFYHLTLQKIAEFHAQSLDEADAVKDQLKALLREPGSLQIAAKETSRHVLPAAMIYDYPIHDALPGEMYSLCGETLAALENGTTLGDTPCFQGNCPSQGDLTTICPSGFWGYRHNIGVPVSIGDQNAETDLMILYSDDLQVSVAVSLDEEFMLRDEHIQDLRRLRSGLVWKIGDEGQEILDLLREQGSHLVYFYCHGGLTSDGVPYLQVGPQDDIWGIITPSLLPNMGIKWQQTKPLVFINGCHTTALEPAKALDLVTSFIKEVRAVGVIGTEITIFEPLATAFAESCLGHFLNGVPIGEAIRLARLKLLQDGNPLGLVYIPFAVSSLALKRESGNNN